MGISAAGVHNIVEDEAGDVERLVLYNSYATTTASILQVEGRVFAIREPILEITASGSSCIRVDHPSDLISLSPADPRILAAFRPQTNGKTPTALDWKAKGNASYKAGNYLSALDNYTAGIACAGSEDATVKQDILRNRAIVNTYLKRYQAAISDAKGALIDNSNDDPTKALNSKAYFRAGRAAYEMRRFEDAKAYFNQACALTPSDKDAEKELNRTGERLTEQSQGNHDFEGLNSAASKTKNRLDCADFLSKVEAKDAGSHGNGLFAACDIAAGELIMCEKALAVAFDFDRGQSGLTVLDAKSQRQLASIQASLMFDLIGKILHSPTDAQHFFQVYDAGYPFKCPTDPVDGLVPADVFRVQAIVQHNSFGCPTISTTSKAAIKQSKSSTGYPSTGLWVTAAYTNHACNGNAMRSFIGDLIILRATRDIKKGGEILMPYRLPHADNAVTQAELRKIWGFTCDCTLCAAETTVTQTQKRERKRLLGELNTLLIANPRAEDQSTASKVGDQTSKRMGRLETTYDLNAFSGRPRLALVAPGLWLCQVHMSKADWNMSFKLAIDVLRNLGFVVTIDEENISIDRAYCNLVGDAIIAATYAAKALQKSGKTIAGLQMLTFARSLYVTMNGVSQGFKEQHDID